MGQMVGADVGDLERAGTRLASYGKQIEGMRRPLRAQLYSTPWRGRAAERFRSDWDGIHGPALDDAGEFLRSAGSELVTHARQQSEASGLDGRGSSPSVWARIRQVVDIASGVTLIAALWTWRRNPYLGQRLGSFRDVSTALDRFSKAQGKSLASITRKVTGSSSQLPRLAGSFGKFVGNAGKLITLGQTASSAMAMRHAAMTGDLRGAGQYLVKTADNASYLQPQVGLVRSAWDLGYTTGSWIGKETGYTDLAADNFMTATMYRRYGGTQLSLEQSRELARRYDGISGGWNYASDIFLNTFAGWR